MHFLSSCFSLCSFTYHTWVMASSDRAISSGDGFVFPQQSLHHSVVLLHILSTVGSRPKRKCFGFFGSQLDPGLASSQFRESKFASHVACANIVIGVWCDSFFSLGEVQRGESQFVGMMAWCDTVQPQSGLHVSERKSSGVEGVGEYLSNHVEDVKDVSSLCLGLWFLFSFVMY